jgi:hypothetical protein
MPSKKTYKIFEYIHDVDISETDIWDFCPEVLNQLLIDHTMSAEVRKEANDMSLFSNIFWGTKDYADRQDGYQYSDQIMPERIIGQNGRIIMPRVLKDKELQDARVKDKAEVFTPSWVCNAQNNLVDNAWFGREGVFNTEFVDEDGNHCWTPTEGKIVFSSEDKEKTWQKYVKENRMEITCGEAPYLVSRYDTTTGAYIPTNLRVGLLDRKLRVVSENTETPKEWLNMAREAYKHTYGYEWQGDNLLLAREALLYTFIEYYIEKFNERDSEGKIIVKQVPKKESIIGIARIISWNIWQMDGIKMVVPNSCGIKDTVINQNRIDLDKEKNAAPGLFSFDPIEPIIEPRPCEGCKTGDVKKHNGIYCLIRDWD